jgi:hypothetical protein
VGCETDPVFVTDFSLPSRPTYYSYKGVFFFPTLWCKVTEP